MHLTRHVLSCLVIAIIVALGTNGMAMAANDVQHQAHCVNASGETSQDAGSDRDHEHDHDGMVAEHTASDHDHDTCMIHACPALSVDTIKLVELLDTFSDKLSWPEHPLLALALADGLYRPPKS